MSETVIRTDRLTRRFGSTTAVSDVTLEVSAGEVFALLGPNGGGKTTTVRMLCCLLAPSSGTAEVLGESVSTPQGSERIRSQVGYLPELPGLYDRLSAYRNLDFHAQLYGLAESRRAERIEQLLRMLDVWERRNDPVATFSRGMRQKIALARAVVHDPKLLVLDEPTANLDPEAALTVREMILDLRREGRTVFLNTHNLDEAQRISDRVAILRTSLRAVGRPKELATRQFGTWTRIELESASGAAREALQATGVALEVRGEGRQLEVRVADPVKDNPVLTAAVVRAGGRIIRVGEEERGLEELYFSLVGGTP